MKHAHQVLRQPLSNARLLQVEDLPPSLSSAANCLPRLALGGAICGSFVGSFAGALLGMAIGTFYRDISLGLDGALLGGVLAAAAGAIYGLVLALCEERTEKKSAKARRPAG